MQTVAFPSRPARPVMAYETRNPTEIGGGIGAVWALLEEIKSHEPSRSELAHVIGAASGGALNQAACARVADAVLALWKR